MILCRFQCDEGFHLPRLIHLVSPLLGGLGKPPMAVWKEGLSHGGSGLGFAVFLEHRKHHCL